MPKKDTPRRVSNRFDVVVRGEGIAATLAATDFARVGLRTALVSSAEERADESTSEPRKELRDAASSWGGVVAGVCDELGVTYREQWPAPGEATIFGIPGSPLSPHTRAAMGSAGAARVYLDRLKPLLAIGEEHNLAQLVRARMGRSALDVLVRPVTRRELDCEPEDVDIRDVAPGLLQAMSRVGSLSLGVLELASADPSTVGLIVPDGGLVAIQHAAEREADFFAVNRGSLPSASMEARVELDLSDQLFNRALHVGIPRARERARELRRELLRDPDYSPIGPVDLED